MIGVGLQHRSGNEQFLIATDPASSRAVDVAGLEAAMAQAARATMLAPRKAWTYSVPPSERRRVEHCGHLILREQ